MRLGMPKEVAAKYKPEGEFIIADASDPPPYLSISSDGSDPTISHPATAQIPEI